MHSRLDKRYLYLHFDLPSNKKIFGITASSSAAVDTLIDQVLNGEFLKALNSLTPNYKPTTPEIFDSIEISWANYKTNYLDTIVSKMDDDDIIDDNDDDDDEETGGPLMMFPPGAFRQENSHHYTPWGKFSDSNPLSPLNLYELNVVNFKGFNIHDIPDWQDIINSARGVAIFSMIDKYSILIATAKSYTFREVRLNVENAIYKALNISNTVNGSNGVEEYILEIQAESKKKFESGIDNFAIVFNNEEFSVDMIDHPSDKDESDINGLLTQLNDIVVFKNGEIYDGKS